MTDREKVIRIIYKLIFEAQKEPTWRDEVSKLQKNCPMVEWEPDMGATVPYCKIYRTVCNGQCEFKTDDCHCDTEKECLVLLNIGTKGGEPDGSGT